MKSETTKRKVIHFSDLPKEERDALLKALEETKMDPKHDHLNAELEND